MQWLRLAGDGDHRPGFAGRIIRLVGPQLAVEADSLELTGDRHDEVDVAHHFFPGVEAVSPNLGDAVVVKRLGAVDVGGGGFELGGDVVLLIWY